MMERGGGGDEERECVECSGLVLTVREHFLKTHTAGEMMMSCTDQK